MDIGETNKKNYTTINRGNKKIDILKRIVNIYI